MIEGILRNFGYVKKKNFIDEKILELPRTINKEGMLLREVQYFNPHNETLQTLGMPIFAIGRLEHVNNKREKGKIGIYTFEFNEQIININGEGQKKRIGYGMRGASWTNYFSFADMLKHAFIISMKVNQENGLKGTLKNKQDANKWTNQLASNLINKLIDECEKETGMYPEIKILEEET